MKMDNFKRVLLVDNKKIVWKETEADIEVPVDKILKLENDNHYELKLVSNNAETTNGLKVMINKKDLMNKEITRVLITHKKDYTAHPVNFRISVMAHVYDVTKAELTGEALEAEKKLKQLASIFGEDFKEMSTNTSSKTTEELKKDVNQLFEQFFKKPVVKGSV